MKKLTLTRVERKTVRKYISESKYSDIQFNEDKEPMFEIMFSEEGAQVTLQRNIRGNLVVMCDDDVVFNLDNNLAEIAEEFIQEETSMHFDNEPDLPMWCFRNKY